MNFVQLTNLSLRAILASWLGSYTTQRLLSTKKLQNVLTLVRNMYRLPASVDLVQLTLRLTGLYEEGS